MTSPILALLAQSSSLRTLVKTGLGALLTKDKSYIDGDIRARFTDSLNLDAAMQPAHPNDNRWDYLLGLDSDGPVVGLEPHSATEGEISVVIKKKEHSQRQLLPHVASGKRIAAWYWVASGTVDFPNHDRAVLRCAQHGITFVGKKLHAKHLPGGSSSGKPTRKKLRGKNG